MLARKSSMWVFAGYRKSFDAINFQSLLRCFSDIELLIMLFFITSVNGLYYIIVLIGGFKLCGEISECSRDARRLLWSKENYLMAV